MPSSFDKVGEGLISSLMDESVEEETEEEEVEEETKETEEEVEEETKETEEEVEEKKEETKEESKEAEKNTDKANMSKEELAKLKEELFNDLKTSLEQGKEQEVQLQPEDNVESKGDDIKTDAQKYLDMDEEELRDAFFENPKEVVNSIVQSRLDEELAKERQKYEPVVKEYALNKTREKMQEAVTNFAKEHEDFEKHSDAIADILRKEQLDMSKEKSLEYAYYKAKASNTEQVDASKKTLDEFVSDEDAIKELTKNETLQSKIIEDYLKDIATGKRDPATLTDGTGESPMSKKKKTSTFDEISDSLYRKLR